MTTNLTSNGSQLPLGRPSSFPPSSDHLIPQAVPQFTKPWLPELSTRISIAPPDVVEPPLKRQRLEDASANLPKFPTETAVRGLPDDSLHIRGEASTAISSEQTARDVDTLPYFSPLIPLRPTSRLYSRNLQQGRALAIERAARRDVVPVKAYVPEPPSSAPRFHEAGKRPTAPGPHDSPIISTLGPADFFPWIGNHAEDVLNEFTTKQGFYDKLQGSKDENTTAKNLISASLKHKIGMGVQLLSSLFVQTLEKRQAHGTTVTRSTFKPPPRVTLTDAKKEAWLKDLANSSVPLRRLSRTIPHGIRDRILLDHCLNKDIPISRAVWLAKCVGANEIRAAKRNRTGAVLSIGAETKWIRDWTAHVEKFIESIIKACGSPGWRIRIDYGLRLASHLYSDHLLDQGHYLNWIISSFRSSDLDKLPVFFLILHMHQQELLLYRQRGRRLAEAVLEHIHNVCLPAYSKALDAVSRQIVDFAKFIMVSKPTCYLIPDCWTKYEATFRRVLEHEDDQLRSRFEHLSRRNLSLRRPSLSKQGPVRKTPRQQVIDLLDNLTIERNFKRTAGTCLRLASDYDHLVTTCIEWSASLFRVGRFRIYAAARLLRAWSRQGLDLQRPISQFLCARPDLWGMEKHNLYRLLTELVSSKHFSVGRYIQWLMARGALHGCQWPDFEGRCEIHFLFEIPLNGLPENVLNLRQSLLSQLAVPSDYEAEVRAAAKANVASRIRHFFASDTPLSSENKEFDIRTLSCTYKSDVARWIRQTLILRHSAMRNRKSSWDDDDTTVAERKPGTPSFITFDQFVSMRGVLEDLGDFTILADALSILSDEVQGSILTAVADTVNFYFDIFDAIGAAKDIARKMFSQLEELSGQECIERSFVESLIDLARRMPDTSYQIQRLRKELALHTPKPLAVACSPISDNMVEAVQSTELTFADDMDQMLACGTSMDKQTMSRVFETIMIHLEKSFKNTEGAVCRDSQLLARLRSFDVKVFDHLFQRWIHTWFLSHDRPKLSMILAPIVCSRIFLLKKMFHVVTEILSSVESQNDKVALATEALELTLDLDCGRMPTVDYRVYRLSDQLARIIRTSPNSIVKCIHTIKKDCIAATAATRSQAQTLTKHLSLHSLAKTILLQRRLALKEDHTFSEFEQFSKLDEGALAAIINNPYEQDCSLAGHLGAKVIDLLDHLSDFNLLLAQIELKAMFQSPLSSSVDHNGVLSEILVDRSSAAKKGEIDLIICLVADLPDGQASSVRERAESELLATVVRGKVAPSQRAILENLFLVINATAFTIEKRENPLLIGQISDYLDAALRSSAIESACEDTYNCLHELSYLDLILRILVCHQTTIQHANFPQALLYRLLMSLSLLAAHSATSTTSIGNQLLDVVALLSDSLSDENRSRCINTLEDQYHVHDPRLSFIYGYRETLDSEWLQLATKISPSADGAVARNITQPYHLRRWEMMQDATPVAGVNDTSLSLSLFSARRSVL